MGLQVFKDSRNDLSQLNSDLKIVWLDYNVDNEENKFYQEEMKEKLKQKYNLDLYPVKELEQSISILKTIKFAKTIIIVSGKYYEKFYDQFYSIQNEFLLKENIVIFCGSKRGFLFWCENNNIYINEDLVFDKFEDLLNFLIDQKIPVNEEQYSFDIITTNNELIFPLFYQDFFTIPSYESIYLFHNILKESFKDNKTITKLLEQLENVYDINVLCKYWMKIYSEETDFYKEMNMSLRKRKNIFKYMTFIKLFYQGLKLNIFKPVLCELYRGSIISNKEFENFKKFKEKKLKNNKLKMIIYSITFLSFSKSKNVAEQFLLNEKEENIKILFEIIPSKFDKETNNEKISNIDISSISSKNREMEVLFGPFSVFEFTSIEEISNTLHYSNNTYKVTLEYLGKYRKEILEEFDRDNILDFVPPTKFSLEMTELGFIQFSFKLNWSIKKKINKKISNFLYVKNNIIASYEKEFFVFNKNLEIIDLQKNLFNKPIIGLEKINDNTIALYSKKNLKIFEFSENSSRCEYKFIQNILLENGFVEAVYMLSNNSFIIFSNLVIDIYIKKNDLYESRVQVNNELEPEIISLIELPYINNEKGQLIYFTTLSPSSKLKFWNNNLKILNELELSDKPIRNNLMIYKNYIIVILLSSISIVNYQTKTEEIIFSLSYQSICFNKLAENLFILSMKDKKNNYFLIEYKIYKENNKILIENIGNSNIEHEQIFKIINLDNNKIITMNKSEIIYWTKNRKLNQKIIDKNFLKKSENRIIKEETYNIINLSNIKYYYTENNSMSNSLIFFEQNIKNIKSKKNIIKQNYITNNVPKKNDIINNINKESNLNDKYLEESKLLYEAFPSPYNSINYNSTNISKMINNKINI